MSHEDIIRFMRKLLNFTGTGADKMNSSIILLFFIPTTILYLAVYQLFDIGDISFETMTKIVESIFSCSHFTVKYLLLIIKRKEIIYLLNKTKNFSTFDGFNENFQRSCRKELRFIRLVVGVFASSVLLGVVFFILKPFVSDEVSFLCYKPQWVPIKVFNVINSLTIIPIGLVLLTFDLFTFTLISLLRVQMGILNHKISTLSIGDDHNDGGDDNVLSRMKVLVDFHNFLYRYFISINGVFGLATLLQLFIFIWTMCFELYIASRTEDLANICNVLIHFYVISFETVICYCWPASRLTEEFSNTSFCLYDTNWYNCSSISIRKSLLIMMTRCQSATVMCYRCMFIIDMELCTNAFNTAFSYFTVLKTMSQKFATN